MFFDLSFGQQLVANLAATFIGVALGIPVAFWINNRQAEATKNDKQYRILTSLWNEVGANLDTLKRFSASDKTDEDIETLYLFLRDPVWRAFADGDELQWIDNPALLALVANAYFEVSVVKYLGEKYYEASILRRSTTGSAIATAGERLIKTAIEALDTVGKAFESIQNSGPLTTEVKVK